MRGKINLTIALSEKADVFTAGSIVRALDKALKPYSDSIERTEITLVHEVRK